MSALLYAQTSRELILCPLCATFRKWERCDDARGGISLLRHLHNGSVRRTMDQAVNSQHFWSSVSP